MPKVIITGGAGFIGSHLVDHLVNQDVEVIILDNLSTGKKANINPKAQFIECDISKTPIIDLFFHFVGVDIVFHLAAKTSVQESITHPEIYNETNVLGTLKILEASRMAEVKRVIFSSSSSVYGNAAIPTPEAHTLNPISPYALNKLMGEQYCKLYSNIYNLDTVCLRYFNVYGDRMNLEGAYKLVIPIFTEQILNGEPMTINGDGEQKRDFVHVDDVVQANISAATSDNKFKGEIINIGSGDNRSVNQIADMLGKERVHLDPVIEPKATLANNKKARDILNFSPSKNIEDWIPSWKKEMGL